MVSEKKRAANARNARAPRGSHPKEPERVLLDQFKASLRELLCEPATFDRFAAIIRGPSPPEIFLRAFEVLGDRVGFPRVTQTDMTLSGEAPLLIQVERFTWPD